jgi:hypothetical protein
MQVCEQVQFSVLQITVICKCHFFLKILSCYMEQ